jgi:hypothetical protein
MPHHPESDLRFTFSLRTLLVVLILVGVAAGLLGRLYFRNAEMFFIILVGAATLGPFLAAVVTIVCLGIRRGGVASIPICAECRCDLRRMKSDRLTNCPKCNVNLTSSNAVQFVIREGSRRWGLVVWGGVLLVTPLLGVVLVFVAERPGSRGPGNLGVLTTRQLIQQRLPSQVDQPWVWKELKSRLDNGSLSQRQVDDAVKELISHMTSTSPGGWDSPLSWQRDFLQAAISSGKLSDPVLFDLCDAYFGPQPVIEPLPRVRETSQGLDIKVEYGTVWTSNSGLGVEMLWQVSRVLLDGEPVELRQHRRSGEDWSGSITGELEAGDHEVTVEVDAAYVDQAKLIGLSADTLPMNVWPKARKRWKHSVSAPLKVYATDDTIVPLTTDPEDDPVTNGGITIDRFVAQADHDGKKKIILRMEFTDVITVPLSCDVAVILGDQEIPLGCQWVAPHENGRSSGGRQLEKRIDTLDPGIEFGQIILTPNPRHIEQRPEVKEIWGKKIVLGGIAIERLDLEAGQGGEGP